LVDLWFAVDLQSRFILTVINLTISIITLEYSTPIYYLNIFCKHSSFNL